MECYFLIMRITTFRSVCVLLHQVRDPDEGVSIYIETLLQNTNKMQLLLLLFTHLPYVVCTMLIIQP